MPVTGLAASAVVGSLAAAAGYWGVGAVGSRPGRWLTSGTVVSRVRTRHPVVALTFDDGPDPSWTPQVLAALDGPATFFALGEQVRKHPGTARDAVRLGHEVACHGDQHARLVREGPRATFHDLRDAHAAITEATGLAPAFFRPPHGVLTGPALLAARRLGMRPALWSASAGDWRRDATADSICRNALAGARPGAVLLLHDAGGWPGRPAATVAALPDLLRGLRRQGLEPVTLSTLWEGAA